MSEYDKEKENVLNVIFAVFRLGASDDETLYIKYQDLEKLVTDLKRACEEAPIMHYYNMPDLSINSLKRNKCVEYVALDSEVAFDMDKEEAKKLIDRNPELSYMIATIGSYEHFDVEVTRNTAGVFGVSHRDPNTEYTIGIVDNGMEKKINMLYTDGDIEYVEDQEGYRRLNVTNSTYTIVTAEQDGAITAGLLRSDAVLPEALDFLMDEVMAVYNGGIVDYNNSRSNVLVRRKH